MNIIKLYQDFGIPSASPGNRHYRAGWVNTPCPFCSGHAGNHLGYCVDQKSKYFNHFVCHRCGGKSTFRTVKALTKINEEGQVWAIIATYGGSYFKHVQIKPKAVKPIVNIDLPPHTKPLKEVPGAIRYLKSRKFDPDEIESVWGVQATGPGSRVKHVDYSYRLIIPVRYQGKVVTYQGRDWTGKVDNRWKYLACLPELESVSIKDILYGTDEAEGLDEAELMEGVTDVWRWGVGAVACFGIKYRSSQVKELIKRYHRVGVMFDPEAQAKLQARKIISKLIVWGLEVREDRIPRGKDPAELTREELKEVLR